MRRNKLYTVNRFNKPAFVDRTYQNIFDGFGQTSLLNPNINSSEFWSRLGVNTQLSNPLGQVGNAAAAQTLANFAPASNTVSNPFSFKEAFSSAGLKNGLKAGVGAAVGLGADVVGGLAGNAISGGLKSGVGSAIGTIGGAAASAIGSVNPLLGAAVGVGSKILGGVTNALFGTKVDQEKLNAANEGTAAYNNFTSNASSFDDISGPIVQANVQDAYSGGIFKKGWARKKNEELKKQRTDARLFADRSIENNVFNLADDQINDALYNYSAFGGPIETMSDNMGAIGYGFMSDYLNNKKKQIEQKGQTNMFAGTPSTIFDFGGDLQTNSTDFSTGLTHINAGGSHEESPYDGVQMGVDQEGTPNLVEEGETVYDNYVFSNRILADEATKQLFHLPKKRDITFADISKRLEKEITERPNDPISQAGFKAQMQTLEEQQERQKQEMEAERAKAAFEALTPEEQTALMQQAAQQEAMAQETAIQQPSPEEAAMVEQQAQEVQPSQEEMLVQQQAVAALGGRLVKADAEEVNRFDFGGYKKGSRKAKKLAGRMDEEWFKNQAKALGISEDDMKKFVFSSEDPEANLINFNAIYKDAQKKKALDTYSRGQRQAKENELFGENGMYRMSDDNSKVYKARVRKDGEDWINANGDILDQDAYNKLSDSDKEAYRQIKTRVGDKLYDYNNKLMEDEYKEGRDALLNSFDYNKGFKWDDKDAQTLQYPVEIGHSALSNLRYAPALGGLVGLAYDAFNPADYSSAEAIEKAGSVAPMFVSPNYRPTYMKPHVFDVWQQRNRNTANLNSAIRAFENTVNPNKGANILATLYNATNLDGQLGIDADKYNREDAFKVAAHNSGENKTLAQLDMQAQLANQRVYDDAQRLGFQGRLYGARMRDDIDARRAASLSANATNLLQSIGNIGEEAYDEDRLKWLEGTGVLRSDYFNKGKYSAAKGGKLRKKKKGLTY